MTDREFLQEIRDLAGVTEEEQEEQRKLRVQLAAVSRVAEEELRKPITQAGIEALADVLAESIHKILPDPRKKSETGAYKSLLATIESLPEDG